MILYRVIRQAYSPNPFYNVFTQILMFVICKYTEKTTHFQILKTLVQYLLYYSF